MKSEKIKKIDFECDGFDLDYEIVGKLIKKKIIMMRLVVITHLGLLKRAGKQFLWKIIYI